MCYTWPKLFRKCWPCVTHDQLARLRDDFANRLIVPFKVAASLLLLGDRFVNDYIDQQLGSHRMSIQVHILLNGSPTEQEREMANNALDSLVEKLGGPEELRPILAGFYQDSNGGYNSF